MIRYIYIGLGLISLGLGLLGDCYPPGTSYHTIHPAYRRFICQRIASLHKKLLENKLTGPYINRVNKGFSIKGLLVSIGIMWVMISITAFVVFDYGTMRFVMLGLGVIGTIAR